MVAAPTTLWVRKEGRVQRIVVVMVISMASACVAAPLTEVWPADGEPLAIVDWASREITTVGRARTNPRTPTAFAERAARLDAYGNLAQVARLARIDAARRVGQLVDDDDDFNQAFQAYLRLTAFGPPQRGDGWLTVTARVPLYGVAVDEPASRLGPLLYRRDDVWNPDVETVGEPAHGGVLIDGRELAIAGAFAPRIEDADGRVVWTVECADRKLADEDGAVDYRTDWDAALSDGRAGESPWLVRPVRADGPVIVVSVADGLRLAPRREAAAGWRPIFWRGIRTITPVSPFQRVCVVSTAPDGAAAAPADGQEG